MKTMVPSGHKKMRVEGGEVAEERSDRRGLGKTFPNEYEGAVRAQKNEGGNPHFFVPKAGLEPARLFKDIGF